MSTKRKSAPRGKGSNRTIPFNAFRKSLKEGVKPLYVFIGRDRYLRGSCTRAVCRAAGEDDQPCAAIEFTGGQCSISAVFDELKTLPLLDERRIVCVTEARKFVESCSEHLDRWPDIGGMSVLMLLDEKLDRRRKLSKEILERAVTVDCGEMNEAKLSAWILGSVKQAGKKISTDAASKLISRIGRSAAAMEQAIEQIVTFTGSKTEVTTDDIDEAIPSTVFEDVWCLTEAMATGDERKCLSVIDDLMGHGEKIYLILGAVAWHVRRLLSAKYLLNRRVREEDVFRKLKVWPSRAREFKQQLAGFDLAVLRRHLDIVTEADVLAKSSPEPQHRTILETTALQMCRR